MAQIEHLIHVERKYLNVNGTNSITRKLTNRTRDRGVSFGDFFVLRENTKPSILLELGYISNAEDEQRIKSQTYQTQASTAIVEGVIEYLSN
jgi:N-acetylmuramoyl-L-alanine amidase